MRREKRHMQTNWLRATKKLMPHHEDNWDPLLCPPHMLRTPLLAERILDRSCGVSFTAVISNLWWLDNGGGGFITSNGLPRMVEEIGRQTKRVRQIWINQSYLLCHTQTMYKLHYAFRSNHTKSNCSNQTMLDRHLNVNECDTISDWLSIAPCSLCLI